MKQSPLVKRIEDELGNAHRQRALGNEGRARVYARRAAGWAIAIYRQQRVGEAPHSNAYHLLRWFQKLEDIPGELRDAAGRLTTHVTPAHEYPYREDPLDDAQAIVQLLLENSE